METPEQYNGISVTGLKNPIRSFFNREVIAEIFRLARLESRWDCHTYSPERVDAHYTSSGRERKPHESPEVFKSRVRGALKTAQFRQISLFHLSDFTDKNGRVEGCIPFDGNVFDHTQHQVNIARWALEYDKESEIFNQLVEKAGITVEQGCIVMRVLSRIHDLLGETYSGDVPKPKKQPSHDAWEESIGRTTIGDLVPGTDGASQKLRDELNKVYDINFASSREGDAKFHLMKDLFSCYEYMSYLRGAMLGYLFRDNMKYPDAQAIGVIQGCLPKMLTWAEIYPSAKAFLVAHKKGIDTLIAYTQKSRASRIKKFSDPASEICRFTAVVFDPVLFDGVRTDWKEFQGSMKNESVPTLPANLRGPIEHLL